jgi:hypothetical protein
MKHTMYPSEMDCTPLMTGKFNYTLLMTQYNYGWRFSECNILVYANVSGEQTAPIFKAEVKSVSNWAVYTTRVRRRIMPRDGLSEPLNETGRF